MHDPLMPSGEFFDCTRLSDPQRRALLGSLARAAPARADSRRATARYEYVVPSILVTVMPEQGGEMRLQMHARNLSCGGMSLLHGGFLHRKTRCSVVLPSLDGKHEVVFGEVVGCRHISRNIHEVSIQFFDKVSVARFCGPDAPVSSASVSRSAPRRLKGLALVLSNVDPVRREILGWLSATGLDAVEAKTVGAAIDKLRRLPFVVAVIDGSEGECAADEAVKAARGAGFSGGILVLGGQSERIEGAEVLLPRPQQPETFWDAVSSLFFEKAGDESQPVYSTLEGHEKSRALLSAYVEQALGIASTAEEALKTDDRKRITDAFASLKSTAGGYGFGVLGQAAATALVAIQRAKQLKQAERQVSLVISLCRRLSAEPNPKSKAA